MSEFGSDKGSTSYAGSDLAKAAAEAFERVAESERSIGRFVMEFSQLQFSIRYVVAKCIGLDEKYFNIITAPYDFAILCTVARELLTIRFPERKTEFKELLGQCRRLNDERVKVAHGLWTLGDGGLAVEHASRTSLTQSSFFEQREKIDELSAEAQRLMQAVLGFRPAASMEQQDAARDGEQNG